MDIYFILVHVCIINHFSHVWLFGTQWTVASQTPLSLGSSRQEYWNGLPFPSPILYSILCYFFFTQIYTVLTTESSFSWLICPFNINLCVCVCLCVYLGLLTSQHAPGSSCILVLLQVKNKTFIKEHHFISGKLY